MKCPICKCIKCICQITKTIKRVAKTHRKTLRKLSMADKSKSGNPNK